MLSETERPWARWEPPLSLSFLLCQMETIKVALTMQSNEIVYINSGYTYMIHVKAL